MVVPVPGPLCGAGQSQGEEDPDAHAPGKDVGVCKHGIHADARFHRGQHGVIRGESLQDPQHRGADEAGGEQVDAHQARHSSGALQYGGEATSRFLALPIGESQQQYHHPEGGQHHHKGCQGKFSGDGVQGGDAVGHHPQTQRRKGDGEPLPDLLLPEQQCGGGAQSHQQRDPFRSGVAAKTDQQEKRRRQPRRLPRFSAASSGEDASACFMPCHSVPPNM